MAVHRAAAVAGGGALGAPALDDAGVPLTLADTGDVYAVTLGKGIHLDLVAHVQVGGAVELELLEDLLPGLASLLQVAQLRLGEFLLGNILIAQLDRLIAVLFRGLLLDHGAGAGLDDRDRDDVAGFIEDLGHAHFLADDRLFHVTSSLNKVIGRERCPSGWHCSRDLTRPSQKRDGLRY